MRYVHTNEFVEVLKSIGIEIPTNAVSATITLRHNDVVRVEAELIMRKEDGEHDRQTLRYKLSADE